MKRAAHECRLPCWTRRTLGTPRDLSKPVDDEAWSRPAMGDSYVTSATDASEKSSSAARLPRAEGRSRQLGVTRRVWRIGGIAMVPVMGLLLGACGGSSPGPGSSTPSAPATSAASGTGALDPCLVGTWMDRGESDTLSYEGTPVKMDGLVGKTVTVSPGGTETVSFARAAPLQGSVGSSTYTVTESGTITGLVSSGGGVLTFSDVNYTAFSETATLAAATTFPPQPPPPTPDRYTCSATTMSLSGAGLHATFSRASPSRPPTAASTIPDLFVHTAAVAPPGELFVWPEFPASIEMDDNDWIAGITWTASQTGASGAGTSYTDLSCNGPAAACPPTAEGSIEFSATQPETCTVDFADQSTGAQQSEQALVFDHLQYTVTSGPTTGKVYTFSPPCSGASQPPGRCRTSALSAQPFALAGGGAAGSQGGAIGLTNHGSVTCTLFGYPGMQLLGTGGHPLPGEPLPTTVIRGQYEVVDAVPEQTVTLSPGAQARFYYMYSDTLGGGSPAVCPTASAIDITPPGADNQLTVVTDIAPCEGHIWVSPVTASTPYPLVNGSP